MPGAGTLNVRAARPRHWAASAFLAVLGMVRFFELSHRLIAQLCRRAPSRPLLPLYGLQIPILNELDSFALASTSGCAALKRFLCDGAPRNYAGALLNVSPPIVRFAGISSECVNVHAARAFHTRLSRVLATPRTARTFGCAGARASAALHASRSEPLGTSHSISFRVVHYPTGRFGHGTLVELYIYHTRCGPRALLRAHAACSSLWPNGHATGHIVAFRALARIRGSSPWIVGDHASPRSLIMTAGSVLRPTSSSASIDAILNAFVATRSRSAIPVFNLSILY
ncbi:hypothetical protein A0H81_12303 [Grifola frondosa]|uniref:Uncharacterized protein n=1 Tax=Grifola frondosa TaxID=5627 RepID=A0A1C7LUF0_GRIFR|nr:hypothetical protein A0H81_12303 [Grifola frondosa]